MKRFLYVIQTKHNGILGFGVCADPRRRLQDYVAHSACVQEFACLYYGNKTDIDELEDHVKSAWSNIRLNINGRWKWEWLDPESGKSIDDLVELIDGKIEGHPMPSVRKLRQELLPFKNYYSKSEIRKECLNYDPDKYLDASLGNKSVSD